MTGEAEKEIIPQQRAELEPDEPALGEEHPALFHVVREVRPKDRILDDDGLAQQRAVPGAADPEDICETVNVLQRQVVLGRGQGNPKTGTIQHEEEVELLAHGGDSLELALGVHGADVSRVRDKDQLGLGLLGGDEHCMFAKRRLDLLGRQFAVHARLNEDLVSGCLNVAAFFPHSVSRLSRNECFVRADEGRDRQELRSRAARGEVDCGSIVGN